MDINSDELLKLDNQLCFPLYAAARKITSQYTPLLKPLKLTYTQYIVMLVLWEEDGISVGRLCERLHLDNGTVSPLLKKMEKTGYVHRDRNDKDERIVKVFLTEEGKELKEKAKSIPLSIASCNNIGQDKGKMLYKLLYELING
ncbi:MAG: MarR family transcriptional regulator [Lachnospiraceae bacterium]|nr:MarR family transcriptional regulator [Lachnospiraceae bacterium]